MSELLRRGPREHSGPLPPVAAEPFPLGEDAGEFLGVRDEQAADVVFAHYGDCGRDRRMQVEGERPRRLEAGDALDLEVAGELHVLGSDDWRCYTLAYEGILG